MRALMASVNPGGPAAGGGGFFNRVSGSGNLPATGGGSAAAVRLPSFDAESAQLRGGMLALTRAMYSQANALNTMTGSLRTGISGAPAGGTGGAAQAADDSSGGGGNLLAGFGRRFATMFAIHGIVSAIGAAQTQAVSNEGLDRKLALGDFGGAISEQLSQARSMREGFGGKVREKLNMLLRPIGVEYFDDEARQHRLETAQMQLQGSEAQDQAREQMRAMRQHNELYGLGAYRASRVQAQHAVENATHDAQALKSLAKKVSVYDPGLAESLNVTASQIEAAGPGNAYNIQYYAEQAAATTGMGLDFRLRSQNLRNALRPGAANAVDTYAGAAEMIRAMLLGSSPENAEKARQLGLAQLQGDWIQTIMAGRGSSLDSTSELVGPQPGSQAETVSDILKQILDLIQDMNGNLQSIGEVNPLDTMN